MNSPLPSAPFRIGMVARLSGVPAATIRMWERRYGAVDPQRAPRGGRLYTGADVARLSLLRELTERGHAIGTIARLGNDELHERLRGGDTVRSAPSEQRCRVVTVGPSLGLRLTPELAKVQQVEVLADCPTLESLHGRIAPQAADVILCEFPTLQPALVAELGEVLQTLKPRLLIVVYGFGTQRTLRRLDHNRMLLLRAPVDAVQLLRACLLSLNTPPAGMPTRAPDSLLERVLYEAIPARAYSDAQLQRLSSIETTIRCECPQHLAELLRSLVAFEIYSEECENANLEDAALHALLRSASAHARGLLEQALARILEAERINLDTPRR